MVRVYLVILSIVLYSFILRISPGIILISTMFKIREIVSLLINITATEIILENLFENETGMSSMQQCTIYRTKGIYKSTKIEGKNDVCERNSLIYYVLRLNGG